MKIIKIDASQWTTWQDFYEAVLPAIGAPERHGRNANALTESMDWGEINAVEPPYKLQIQSTGNLPTNLKTKLDWIKGCIEEARGDFRSAERRDVDVSIEIMS